MKILEDTLEIQHHRSRGLSCLLVPLFGERYEAGVLTSEGWRQVLDRRFKSREDALERARRGMARLNQARKQ